MDSCVDLMGDLSDGVLRRGEKMVAWIASRWFENVYPIFYLRKL